MEVYTDGACNATTGKNAWGSVIGIVKEEKIIVYDLLVLAKDVTLCTEKLPANKLLAAAERTVVVTHFNDVDTNQNNGAELVAFTLGLELAQQYKAIKVYTDSELLLKWWSKGHVNMKTKKKMDPKKLEWIQRCTTARIAFEKTGGKVEHISGKENPADLGWH